MMNSLQELEQETEEARLKQASQLSITRVVCSGGGAKAAVYAGSYKAMKDTGVYKKVKEFAGASAGAITAAFMALGMDPKAFREILLTTNLKDLMGNSVGKIFANNPLGISFVTKDGKLLEAFIRKHINATVLSVKDMITDCTPEPENAAFENLKTKLTNTELEITFADLALLNQFLPDHFKKLTLPAVKFPTGEVQIFNADLTPNVEIALACRASASIPVLLAPVEIDIKGDGTKEKFIDGGLYDNLPTDYFDKDDKGIFKPNQHPQQTMVFAFGEGLDNSKNQVFQALYGQRWDEAITDEVLKNLLDAAFEKCKKPSVREKTTPQVEAKLITEFVQSELAELKKNKIIQSGEAKIIMDAMNHAVHQVLLKQYENQDFWQAYYTAQNRDEQLGIFLKFIQQIMKPILYQADFVERLKRDVLIETLGGLKAPYKNTERKEQGYQKLRSQYPLRTVELRVGNIKTTDFNQATKFARIMDSLGFLDTVNHITNHELHDPKNFAEETFYADLIQNFECIFKATLASSGKDPQKSVLLRDIQALKTKLTDKTQINRQVYQFIKDKVERRLDAMEAFALARSVEFHNKTINAEQLFKETYEEGFKRSSIFSISKISGKSIFRSATLHIALTDINMFDLYKARGQGVTRSAKVFQALSEINGFKNECEGSPAPLKINTP